MMKFILTFLLVSIQVFACDVMCKRIPNPNDPSDVLEFMGDKEIKKALPTSFKVLSWNIYKGKREPLSASFKKLANNVDILMLQEMLTSPVLVNLFSNFGKYYFSMTRSFIETNDYATGVLTGGSVYPEKVSYAVSEGKEPIIGTPKVIGINYYPIQGKKYSLLVLNIHGINVTKIEWFIKQLESVRKIIVNHPGPVVFAGDFNTKKEDRIAYMTSYMKSMGMESTAWENPQDGHHQNDELKFLDHLFVRGLEITKAKFIQEFQAADHPAMYVEANVID